MVSARDLGRHGQRLLYNATRAVVARFRAYQRQATSPRRESSASEGLANVGGFALDPGRPVGEESRKSYRHKIETGFFARYLSGDNILEIGFRGGGGDSIVPIVPNAIGIDIDYPGYDGIRLPFADASQDAIYTSHCLEHIGDYAGAIRDWYRVLRVGGFMVIVVPHQWLFERSQRLPSRWNLDHKRYYTPASLLKEIEEVLPINAYRIRHMADNDAGFDYSVGPMGTGVGCFEIELVVEKLPPSAWTLDDGSSRYYSAGEFLTPLPRANPAFIETDFTSTDRCIVMGPYISPAAGDYDVTFHFEAFGLERGSLDGKIVLDVTSNVHTRLEFISLRGADGAGVLKSGRVGLRFRNGKVGASLEFRVFTYGRPFAGRLRVYGVSLSRIWPDVSGQ